MRLMLLRHAKTEKAEPGMRDRDRRLAPRGRKDAPQIGAYLARHGFVPDWPWCRGEAHARNLGGAGRGLPTQPPVDFDERLYQAGPDTDPAT